MCLREAAVIASIRASVALNPWCLAAPPTRSTAAAIDLQYDTNLAAIGFSSPLLRGTIHGRRVSFLIDTGAAVHTLASWLVNEAHIVAQTTNARTKGSTGVESSVKAVYGEEIHVNGRKEDLRLQEAI